MIIVEDISKKSKGPLVEGDAVYRVAGNTAGGPVYMVVRVGPELRALFIQGSTVALMGDPIENYSKTRIGKFTKVEFEKT